MKNTLPRALALWLPLSAAICGVFLFSYLGVQQNYRQSANDPQIQLAEDAAASLAKDDTPANVVPRTTPIDISSSLDTWVAVFDSSGKPLESSATIGADPLTLPEGLFDPSTWRPHKLWHVPTGVETRVSWQPRPDIRQAVVLVQYTSARGVGYVAVGRSMRTVEERIIDLTHLAAVAWGTTELTALFVLIILISLGWL